MMAEIHCWMWCNAYHQLQLLSNSNLISSTCRLAHSEQVFVVTYAMRAPITNKHVSCIEMIPNKIAWYTRCTATQFTKTVIHLLQQRQINRGQRKKKYIWKTHYTETKVFNLVMSVHLEQLHQLQPAVSINSCLYLKNILVRCSERCTRRRTAWQHYHSSYYFSLQMTICRCATAMNMGFFRTMHTHKHKYTLNAHECATSTHLACLRNES